MRYLPGDSQRVRTKVPGADAVRVNVRYVGCSRTDVARWTAGLADAVDVLRQYTERIVTPRRQGYALIVTISR